MTDRIDRELTAFYARISQQPLTTRLESMCMSQFKERAARRLFVTFATGTLIVVVAIAAAVVGVAAHLSRIAPGPAGPHGTIAAAVGPQLGSQPAASGTSTMVRLSGAISGDMRVISTVCWPPSAPTSFAKGKPAFVATAGIEAIGLVNGKSYGLIVSKASTSKQEQAVLGADPHTQRVGPVTFRLFNLGVYGFDGSAGIVFNAEHITIFDIDLTPDQGNGATLTAVGQIVCP